MQSPRSSSPASRAAGCVLAALSLLVGFALGAGKGASLFTSFGTALAASFSWASWLIPLWLAVASLICFLPGFKPAAIFSLIASILPFLAIAALARLTADPASAFAAWPALEALGLPALVIVLAFLVLFLVLLIARLALLFLPRDGEVLIETVEDHPVRRLLPLATGETGPMRAAGVAAAASGPADESDSGSAPVEGAFEFKVPTLPPLPPLRCIDGDAAGKAKGDAAGKAPVGAAKGANGSALAVPAAGVVGAVGAAGATGAAKTMRSPVPGGDSAVSDVSYIDTPPAGAMPAPVQTLTIAVAPHSPEPRPDAPAPQGHVIEFTSVPPGQGGGSAAAGAARAAGAGVAGAADVAADAEAEGGKRKAPGVHLPPRPWEKPYSVPVDGLLNAYPDGQYWIIDEKTKKSAEILQETLAEFGIKAEVTGIRKGPVITMFEILPAPGVRLSKIANLADNIALRLAASSVRIVAPIPGKHAVGIEVPNERRSIVSLREIVENESFRTAKMEIPVALGKDIAGEVQFIDLVQTPHLLIAGATGSGKSVSVNSIILSVLFRRSPQEVRLILIDPKIVELKLYNDVPHLLTPVITEPKRAFQALQYCICEMERRYAMLDRLGVRDIKSYNRKIKEKGVVQERLPYIVVIIDEFADLMATTGKELESTLARLAAMSRAVGIHLVLATQRPSIDVITGLIKANIPSRIAFMVASKFDSRIIIDMVGAEKLLGKGDMLFASAWDPFPIRMQGAFVSEEEVEKSVEFVKTLGEPDYLDEEIFIDEDEEDEGPSLFDDGDDDPLFSQALEIVLQQGKASASYIQRKLKIGYNRAARLVELMEEKGIVGPAQGSKPRDLVRNPEVLGSGKVNTPPANRGIIPERHGQPSLIPGLETAPGEGLSTKGAAASGEGLEED
jgi:S-DNA-T family DNA segregation ATPase FtsK/SpoIIIE